MTKRIEPGTTVVWSDDLASVILEFSNEAAPCNSFKNRAGQSFEEFLKSRLETYKIVLSITFEVAYTASPYEIIGQQLVKGKFDSDMFLGNYEQMGVGCSCHPIQGMECTMVMSDAPSVKRSFRKKPVWSDVTENRNDCKARCTI